MAAAAISTSLRDLKNVRADYDESLCNDISKRLDTYAKDKGFTFDQQKDMAQKNLLMMEKWRQVFPDGVSKCLDKYLQNKAFFTPQFDPRFPNQNQSRACWVNYVDYHRCRKVKGEDYEPCNYFKRVFEGFCPNAWTERWDEQRENGTFAGKV